mgnify:CR=1 FL=1
MSHPSDPSQMSMLDLFRNELQTQVSLLQQALSDLTVGKKDEALEALARGAHSIKGAAKIMQFESIAELAALMEQHFSSFQKKYQEPSPDFYTLLRAILDALKEFSSMPEATLSARVKQRDERFDKLINDLKAQLKIGEVEKAAPMTEPKPIPITTREETTIDHTMMDLFRAELESQTQILNQGLVALEQVEDGKREFPALMRAAHSIKGAARVVGLEPIIQLAHSMEDYFVAAQSKALKIKPEDIDLLFQAVDVFSRLSRVSHAACYAWIVQERSKIDELTKNIVNLLAGKSPPAQALVEIRKETPFRPGMKSSDRVLRVTAKSLNRLMGLAGESLVESRWLHPFGDLLNKEKKVIDEIAHVSTQLRESLEGKNLTEKEENYLALLQQRSNEARQSITDRLSELELFISRLSSLSDRLYHEVIDSRMRPFADGVEGFPRMVRDMARQLNKKVRLEIVGKSTPVDRDILEKLEAPLSHLLRNAVDHGIEPPEQRLALGKPAEGTIRLEAQHRAGMLSIAVSDDGRGLNPEDVRKKIIEKNLVKPELASKLTDNELIDFLYLPGFSTTSDVTEISGRGVGLNVVQTMIQEVAGSIRTTYSVGRGVTFSFLLPLTLSVIRALIVEIAGEPYAFPLGRIERAVLVPQNEIQMIESRQYFNFEGVNIGLVPGWQVLDMEEPKYLNQIISVIILNDRMNSYGLVVDRFLGEKELVVQEIDARLGKVPDISSGAFMEDGSPVMIVDVEDIVRSIDNILSGGRLRKLSYGKEKIAIVHKKRVLVVDDSITVREVECRLLRNHGYEVETAVNGVDGWNAIRIGNYDLIVTDVDMPRMNGIELVKAIRSDPRLKSLPIMIVSYKEREEDRLAGLEAGANYYLTKSSFHDQTLLNGVIDLIGGP